MDKRLNREQYNVNTGECVIYLFQLFFKEKQGNNFFFQRNLAKDYFNIIKRNTIGREFECSCFGYVVVHCYSSTNTAQMTGEEVL